MPTECQRCKNDSPEGKRFCGDCGAPLDLTLLATSQLIDASIRNQIQSILVDRYKDQKLVEVETTQAIAARFSEWAKLLGFFVGIPVALLLLILAAMGIKTYADIDAQIHKAEANVEKVMKTAQDGAAKLKADGDKLATEYDNLRLRYRDTAEIAAQVETLSKRVDTIGEKFGFTSSSKVSDATKHEIEMAFSKYQQYLNRLGYRSTGGRIEIDIRDQKSHWIAYYEPDKRRMVIDRKYANDKTVLYHEYMHHILMQPATAKVNSSETWSYEAIEAGLAWYLPCSFVGNPKPSTATGWNLTSMRSISEIQPSLASAMNDGTEIWGSAFWEVRQALTPEVADKLLFEAWFKLHPTDVLNDHGASFVKLLLQSSLSQEHVTKIREIFTRRGLAL